MKKLSARNVTKIHSREKFSAPHQNSTQRQFRRKKRHCKRQYCPHRSWRCCRWRLSSCSSWPFPSWPLDQWLIVKLWVATRICVYNVDQAFLFYSEAWINDITVGTVGTVVALFDISIWHIDCRYIDTFEKYRYRYRYRYGHIWKYRYRYRYR